MVAVTAELTRLMNNVRINLPGAIDGNVQLELFNTLNEFFSDSKCWLEDIDVRVRAGGSEYVLANDEPGTIISLMSVVDQNLLPVKATMQEPGVLVLASDPGQSLTYTAEVALTVVDPVDRNAYPQFPDWLLHKYYATILAGVLSKMMAQPAKPYSNERMAVFNTRKFRSGIATARAEARHQNVYDAQRWRFPTFARGSQR